MNGSVENQTNLDIKMDVGSAADNTNVAGIQIYNSRLNLVLQTRKRTSRREPAEIPARSGIACLGREDLVVKVTVALESQPSVLLYGMPGIGKSSLAGAAIDALKEKKGLPNGMLWISEIGFAPIQSVCDAIARHLKNNQILQSPTEQKPDLTRELLAKYRGIPVIADEVESYDTAVSIAEICFHAGVSLLMTSRTHHPIAKVEIPVPPLSQEDAIKLFRDKAHLKEEDDVLVSEICTLLECHPLAIVVAARRARAQAIPLEKLKARLENEKTRLPSLAIEDSRDKKSSVWASLNYSYTGLNEVQRTVLTHLAACFGRTTGIELLSKVCELSEMDCEDQIGSLMQHSLVESRGDNVGLQLLIKDFGRDRLAAELPSVQDSIVNAARWYIEKYSEQKTEHFDKLELELGNLLGAIQYAMECQRWEDVLAMAEVLGNRKENMLVVRGYWTEALATREMCIQAAENLDCPGDAARFRHNAATLRQMCGDLKEASRLYEENIKAFDELSNPDVIAASQHNLGSLALDQGNMKEARRLLNKSLKLKKKLGKIRKKKLEKKKIATTLHELGRLAHQQCDFEIALSFYQESLQIDREFQDEDGIGSNQQQIGLIRQLQGDIEQAERLFQRNLDNYRQRDSKAGIASTQLCLGRLARKNGQFDLAHELLEESLASSESLGYQSMVAEITFQMGVLCQEQGQLDQASLHYEASRGIYQVLNDRLGAASCENKQGVIALYRDQLDLAEEMLKSALAVFEAASDDVSMAASLRTLGKLCTKREQLSEAEKYLNQAKDIEEKMGNQLGLAHSWYALAQLAIKRGNIEEAKSDLERNLEILELMHSPIANRIRRELTVLSA